MARYTIDGVEYPGVTTILGLLDKSDPLMRWAVSEMDKHIRLYADQKDDMFHLHNDTLTQAKTAYKVAQQEAMSIGTEVHNLVEKHIKESLNGKGVVNLSSIERDEVKNAFVAFLEWEAENIEQYLESEQPVVNKEIGYAGTLDIIAVLKTGKTYVIDMKVSNGFYDGMDLQIAAYKMAREELKDPFNVAFRESNGFWSKKITQKAIVIDGIGILRLGKFDGKPEFKDYSKKLPKLEKAFTNLIDFYYNYKKRRLKNNPRSV